MKNKKVVVGYGLIILCFNYFVHKKDSTNSKYSYFNKMLVIR